MAPVHTDAMTVPCRAASSGHQNHVGAGSEMAVGHHPQPMAAGDDVGRLMGHQLCGEVTSALGGVPEDLIRSDGIELIEAVEAIEDRDVDTHRLDGTPAASRGGPASLTGYGRSR
jgi:hypothetical protein